MRVYCATFYGETNTFSPIPTGREDFLPMALAARGTPSFEAAFAPLRARGGEVAGTFNRAALPGGLVVRRAYESLREELLLDLARARPVDLVALNLHGALAADGYPDCEGDILRQVRAAVGAGIPITASLDPHAHLTAAMLEAADALVAYREYPHTDEATTFAEAVAIGLDAAAGRVRPRMASVPLGQIAEYHTTLPPMREVADHMRELAKQPGVLAASLIHGFPWGDVPDMGSKSLVVTDGRESLARELAAGLAERVRALRGRTSSPVSPYEEALDEAERLAGPVIVADVCDNPGGGAPGDATFLLESLLRRGTRAALGPLWDPLAVSLARKAGCGAHLPLRLGGKTGTTSGRPVDVRALVIAASERLTTPGVGGYDVDYGASASIRVGSLDIVLTSLREQAMSPRMFTALSVPLADPQMIVVKSAQHFRAAYAGVGTHILHAASPGALRLDFAAIPYRYADRSLWPLCNASAGPPAA
jgi:microcystin degradation protein MlrC